jgi:hypothetical protein
VRILAAHQANQAGPVPLVVEVTLPRETNKVCVGLASSPGHVLFPFSEVPSDTGMQKGAAGEAALPMQELHPVYGWAYKLDYDGKTTSAEAIATYLPSGSETSAVVFAAVYGDDCSGPLQAQVATTLHFGVAVEPSDNEAGAANGGAGGTPNGGAGGAPVGGMPPGGDAGAAGSTGGALPLGGSGGDESGGSGGSGGVP